MSAEERCVDRILTVDNNENCSNYISKGLRTMFARQFDICFYIVNNIVKQDLKMTKILAKTVIQSLSIGPKG